MLEFLVKYYADKRRGKKSRHHEVAEGEYKNQLDANLLRPVDISEVKNSVLYDLQSTTKDLLGEWQRKESVKTEFVQILNDIAAEISRRKSVVTEKKHVRQNGPPSQTRAQPHH